jgi:uncharacterized protein (TIGR03435 family)
VQRRASTGSIPLLISAHTSASKCAANSVSISRSTLERQIIARTLKKSCCTQRIASPFYLLRSRDSASQQSVTDETGVQGAFDLTLDSSPRRDHGRRRTATAIPEPFTALQEQLGLR